jgi:integrase/recombinase XerD
MTINEYLKQLKEKGYAAATIAGCSYILKKFERFPLSKEGIQSYMLSLRRYKLISQVHCLEIVRNYLRTIDTQLAKAVIIPRAPKYLPKEVPDQEEIKIILQKPNISTFGGIRDRAILELFYGTGLRRREVINLTIADIDIQKKLVRVEQGKMRKDRIVPISTPALVWLKKYLEQVRPVLNAKSDYLFLSRSGYQATGNLPYMVVKKYSKHSCHKYRHAYATHLLQNGMKETSLQRLLGHSGITTTQIYTQVTIKDIKASYNKHHKRDQWN